MAWTLFPGDPIGLAVLLALFSLCAFYVMLATEFPKVAQVSLVTVCAVVLAQYSNLDNPDWSMTILDLAIKRGAAVLSGLLLGLFVTWVCFFSYYSPLNFILKKF
jgi:hypothetical protein